EEDVVADLHDARELALADIARGRPDHLEVRQRLVEGLPRARADEAQLSRLDHLRVARHGRGEVLDAALCQHRAQLRASLERDRRALDDDAWLRLRALEEP